MISTVEKKLSCQEAAEFIASNPDLSYVSEHNGLRVFKKLRFDKSELFFHILADGSGVIFYDVNDGAKEKENRWDTEFDNRWITVDGVFGDGSDLVAWRNGGTVR